MAKNLKIMAVFCHPADSIDHAGGTLYQHAARGDHVTMVVCTHGADTHDLERGDVVRFGGDSSLRDQKASIGRKETEVLHGLKILGITDVRFLRFPDELLMVTPDLVEAIAKIMAEVQPHLLITHNPTEGAGLADVGHADSAIAALKARYLATGPRFLKKPCGRNFPTQIYFSTMWGETTQLTAEGMRHGNILIDISNVIDKKVKAMDCLQSQYYPGHLAGKVIEDVNGRMGLHWCMSYAESFQTFYPEGYRYLPANEHLMKVLSTPCSKLYKNIRLTVLDVPYQKTRRGAKREW
ncbi:MAG: PIG-L family deacetylase [Acidobacteria bacterium]|nr:PIG-L family deacetylase [Acidobacteriota bacterium]